MIPRIIIALSVFATIGQAFTVFPASTTCNRIDGLQTIGVSSFHFSTKEYRTVELAAKKRRRRRKESPSSSSSEDAPVVSSSELSKDELPDFDLDDEEEFVAEKPKRLNTNEFEITESMMGSTSSATRSVNELIQDRSLESKFEFDEKGDPSIPDFVDLAQASSTSPTYSADDSLSTAGVGKKKQRRAERVANALAAKEAEKEEKSFLSNVPQFLDEKGNVSAIKILEQGAWIGIFLLVGWEVYINSPFFERAAPMAPIVYELLM